MLKWFQTSSATSTHVHLFSRRSQKASPEPPRTKSIRCASMPLRPMRQSCRFRCVIVRFIFNISPSAWRNATVQGRASISQTTPITTSTHLGPNHPPHLSPVITAVVIIFRQIDVNDRFVALQGCGQGLTTVKCISEQFNFDACWKSVNFNALISECLDLKEGVSIQPFCWSTTPNQNKCKMPEDHMMPKSS